MKHNHTCHADVKTDENICIAKGNSFIKRLFHYGTLRFAGWWSIFAGLLAINSVCPACGSSACPVGIGATGIIAGCLAAVKQWGGQFIKIIRHNATNLISSIRKMGTPTTR